jgi:exodeoxyribonuclease-5
LAGVAGSGKTALTGYLTKLWLERYPNLRVGYATLTGKAAQVLNASLRARGIPASASTIHSLVYRPVADEDTGRVLHWAIREDLDLDLIVLDEASMVDEDVYRDIASYKVPILAVGDHKQMPPVGSPPFLMAKPDYVLDQIHRQARGNPVIELSAMAREGIDLSTMIQFIEEADDPRVTHGKGWGSVTDALASVEDGGLVLVHSNRTRVSLNHQARKLFWGRKHNSPPRDGEVVICVKNYRTSEGVIANGQRGTIVEITDADEHRYKMTVDLGGGHIVTVPASKHQFGEERTFGAFTDVPGDHRSWSSVGSLWDFGYTLTVHKSQGSQDDNVVVLMTDSLRIMEREDRIRWAYTAFTRSSKNLRVITHL